MRALVYASPRKVLVEDWPRPYAGMGEVEIAVSTAGICGADVTGFLGRSRRRKPPMVLGHELVGRTADGRRVVADPLITCGRCAECVDGRGNLCRELRLLGMDRTDGCFAEYVVVPEAQVHAISDELDVHARFLPSHWPTLSTCSGWLSYARDFALALWERGPWAP
jgi:threonine dehydrogenase-like Zn-dependent dehydrogenase